MVGLGSVRSTSDSGHKVEPKRPPVGANTGREQMQQNAGTQAPIYSITSQAT